MQELTLFPPRLARTLRSSDIAVDFSFPFSAGSGVRLTDTISTVVTAPLAAFAFWLVGGGVGLPLRWARYRGGALGNHVGGVRSFVDGAPKEQLGGDRDGSAAGSAGETRSSCWRRLPRFCDSGDPGLASRKLEFAIRDAPHRFVLLSRVFRSFWAVLFRAHRGAQKVLTRGGPRSFLVSDGVRLGLVVVRLADHRVIFNRPVLVDRA